MSSRKIFLGFVLLALVLITAYPASAKVFFVNDKPLNIMGQLSQSIQYGWHDDFDTYYGFQSAMLTAILEGDYQFSDTFRAYSMLVMSGDLAYELRSGGKWEARGFQASRSDMEWDSDWFRVLKEIHATWTPGDFMFRAGKQMVSWGEMIGFRLLDQVNPVDAHRGPGDLEFETTIVPVWMLRMDYKIPYSSLWLSDMNLQVLYDPRADKAIYSGAATGNDQAGIWAPYAMPVPGLLVGSQNFDYQHPNSWTDPNIGIRFQTKIKDSLASLNFLYGRDYAPLFVVAPAGTDTVDGLNILHLNSRAYFPIRRLLGGMYATELSFLPRPGGLSSPMFRLEWSYAFQSEFLDQSQVSELHDDQRIAAGLDFSVPIRFLNPDQTFRFIAQYYLRRIAGISDGFENAVTSTEGPANKYNHTTTLVVSTSYLTGQLSLALSWMQDWINHAYILKPVATYTYSDKIVFTASITWFEGSLTGRSLEAFDHKDYASFKVQYKFN